MTNTNAHPIGERLAMIVKSLEALDCGLNGQTFKHGWCRWRGYSPTLRVGSKGGAIAPLVVSSCEKLAASKRRTVRLNGIVALKASPWSGRWVQGERSLLRVD